MDLRVACVLIASPAPPAGLFKISLSPSLSRSLSPHILSRGSDLAWHGFRSAHLG